MRLYVSINLPPEMTSCLRQLQRQFPGIRPAADFHLTLQFLGDEIPDTAVPALIENLSEIKAEPFEIELDEAEVIPDSENPKLAWVTCKESLPLARLAASVQQATKPLGFIPDKPFKAHVTLGRYNGVYKNQAGSVKTQKRFIANHFFLMESNLDGQGARHRILHKFRF